MIEKRTKSISFDNPFYNEIYFVFFLITRRVCQHSPVGAVALHVRFTKKKNNKIIFREILYKRKNRPSKTNFSLFTRYRSLEKVYTDGKILHDL